MKQLLPSRFAWSRVLQQCWLAIAAVVLTSQLFAAPAHATGVYQIPPLPAKNAPWILDQAEIISRVNESSLSSELDKLAKATGNEVRFVTLHRLDYGETAQSFAEKLFEKWFPDAEAQANQTVIVLDEVTNNAGIRVGSETQALLTEEIAESVVGETLQAPLRQGDRYNQALIDVKDRLVAVLSGNPDPGPPVVQNTVQVEGTFASAEETEEQKGVSTVWVIGLLIAATVIPMATYYLYIAVQGG